MSATRAEANPPPSRPLPRLARENPVQPMLPRALHYIDVIARAGSVRKASERLNVAASAVNRQLIEMEEELGLTLFERLPRGMRATAAGELLLAHIRRQRGETETLRRQLQELRGARRGEVSLGLVEAAARGLMAELLLSFHRRHPGILCGVSVCGSARLAEEVLAESLELALLYNPPALPELRVLAECAAPLQAVVAPGHPLAGRAELRLAECLDFPVALPAQETGGRALIEAALAGSSRRLEPVLEADSLELLASFASSCGGVTFQSALGIAKELARGELVAVPLRDPPLLRAKLALVARRGRRLSPAATNLAEHLAVALRRA
ncbi:LysR family transcriptional regulator [Falsiroseomonas sp.]|uniref:LysR family transcriptional regulator n=1 Tax=Falsiroseomonas sp. TaxID=2870721 RepID=UPI003F729354